MTRVKTETENGIKYGARLDMVKYGAGLNIVYIVIGK